jgi:type IV pilus assembly protein PilX
MLPKYRIRIEHFASRHLGARQEGAALAVGLMFLILVTLLATVAMRQSITQERMAGGLRNVSLARNAAESALRAGERQLYTYYLRSNGAVLAGDASASQGVYKLSASQVEAFRSGTGFYTTGGQAFNSTFHDYTSYGSAPTARLAQQPVFLIADIGRMRPAGAGTAGEGGVSGKEGYEGSSGGSPAGNADIRVYRITARATGGLDSVIRVTESTYAGRAKG